MSEPFADFNQDEQGAATSEQPISDDEQIRLTAYFLWEQDGRPEGREWDYWLRAVEQHRRQRQFDQLIADNSPREFREG